MFLNTASPRRSFTIPININLQGARRRQTRHRELLNAGAVQELEWTRGGDPHRGQRARPTMSVSSIGEDRAILLGFSMMAFAVLMFFVVGFTTVKPYINSNWEGSTNCTLLHTQILEEWVNCRGVSSVPCLRVTVNLTGSSHEALLHFDEESVLLTPECFYVPKCRMDAAKLETEVQELKESIDAQLGTTFTCLTDETKHPKDSILGRKYTFQTVLVAMFWPCLMLGGGVLLVGLVKLSQYLSHLCCDGGLNRHAKLYTLLRRSSVLSPT